MKAKRKVVVIGAGLAGLASAYALTDNHIEVIVLEASAYPGGRAAHDNIREFQIELGANLFLKSYTTAFSIASRLGTPLKPTALPINSGIYRNGRFHCLYGDKQLINSLKTVRTMLSFQLLSPRGVWQAMKFARMVQAQADKLDFDNPGKILSLDRNQSVAEFFETEIGTESLDWLYGPGLAGYTFANPEQVGIAYAKAVLWHNGLNGVAWPWVPDGGMRAFVDAFSKKCRSSIRLSTPVRRILIEGGTARGVITDTGTIESDAVICATPTTALLEIAPELPASMRSVLQRVTYSRCCRVFFGVDSSPLPKNWYAVSFPQKTGTILSGMSHLSLLSPQTAPQGKALIDALLIDKHANELFALSDEEITERVLLKIREYFPKMPSKPLFSHVQKWPEALCLSTGGTMTALDQMQRQGRESVQGLFFAGDYMGIPSLNSALQSGLAAAEKASELPA
ncbi:MAG: NAD(P)/FAD-dependent oxidoreductase [Gammaproteobacteria bacterium]|nr:NAD(P)/FAD-dependent oxidoreductase [Gammaproteobacteria bacterium]MCY4227763.1 NAD(P)/FAD-dependent oxidoreductase [Gammaproteobacteria bacterium]MCY4312637.1 NAD(P)/FAD-dependent oxidoreductase [Gammaproteobacteria bacterium]